MKLLNYFRGEAFQRGVHPPSNKEATADRRIRRLPYPDRVTVPLSQHIGKVPHAIVKVGEEVVRGQPIARSDDWLSVPHHAPITGVVEAIDLRPSARGPWTQSIVIRALAGATQEDLWGQTRDMETATGAEILQAIWDSGMVGLGGAAFPTHAKLSVPKQAHVHTLVVNGCEPQGSEKMLLMALFGVEIASGALPVSMGMVVNNVGTLAALGKLLPRGQGLTERVVTVTGPGVKKPGDYRVPIGTPLKFVLAYAGVEAIPGLDRRQVILGGPMMGQAIASLDVPITKGVSGVLVFRHEDMWVQDGRKTYPCIKCGECVESCPMGLNPSTLGMLAAKREYDLMGSDYHLGDCFECGCCTYVCPSNIPLVQQFRVAKQILRERAAA